METDTTSRIDKYDAHNNANDATEYCRNISNMTPKIICDDVH